MYRSIATFFLLAISTTLIAQNNFRKNDVYFELLGNGIGASLNYERQLQAKPGFGVRVGIGYFSGDEKFRVSIPIGVNYLFRLGSDKSFLEAGVGGTVRQCRHAHVVRASNVHLAVLRYARDVLEIRTDRPTSRPGCRT